MQDETSKSEPKASESGSKTDENSSETLTGNPKSRFVYDFLYHDARRVGSFLAQFEAHGVPGAIKAAASSGQIASDRKQISGSIGLPLVAKAQASLDIGITDEERDTTEKTFDPFWNNAVRFLDYIDDVGLLQRNIFSALLGQIVLVQGSLVILDPSILKDCYAQPAIKSMMRDGFVASIPDIKNADKKKQSQFFDVFVEILSRIPHTTQAHIVSDHYSAWAGLRDDSLVSSTTDLMLKGGALVPGPWTMIGVMDSFPKFMLKPNDDGTLPDFDAMIQSMTTAPIAQMMTTVAPMIRMLLGRPENFYGITPLLIFREVGVGSFGQTKLDPVPRIP